MDLAALIQRDIQDSQLSMEQLAERLGKGVSSLYNEVNPADHHAKLGVLHWNALLHWTRSHKSLQHIASAHGYRLVPITGSSDYDKPIAVELLETHPCLADFHRAIMEGKPLEEVGLLMQEAIREIEEDFTAFRRALAEKS